MLDLTLGTDGGGAEEDEATWALDVLDNIRHGARFSFIPLMMGPEYKARTLKSRFAASGRPRSSLLFFVLLFPSSCHAGIHPNATTRQLQTWRV